MHTTDLTTDLRAAVDTAGHLHLEALPYRAFREAITSLGTIIQRTEVRVRPESKAMVTSHRSLDLHTDHHAARYIAWYCHRQSDEGGESLLLDARAAFDRLPLSLIHI